jgi:hypothetical protein
MNPSFPGFENLFSISDPFATRPFRGSWKSEINAGSLLRAEILPNEPVIIKWLMGGEKTYDLIWTGMASPIIVHQRVIDLLVMKKITGWKTYETKIIGKRGEEKHDCFGLAITGRCDPFDLSKSEIVLKKNPARWSPVFRGQYFEPNSWDGSDFFMEKPDTQSRKTGFVMVTAAVREAFRIAKINNIRFVPLSEWEIDTSIYEIGKKYRLPKDHNDRIIASYRNANLPIPEKYEK